MSTLFEDSDSRDSLDYLIRSRQSSPSKHESFEKEQKDKDIKERDTVLRCEDEFDMKCHETQLEIPENRVKMAQLSLFELLYKKHKKAGRKKSRKINVLGVGERFFYQHNEEDGMPEAYYVNCSNVHTCD